MKISFCVCLPLSFDASYDYIHEALRQGTFEPKNPSAETTYASLAAAERQGDDIYIRPDEVESHIRKNIICGLLYWGSDDENLFVEWRERGQWWEFAFHTVRGKCSSFLRVVNAITSDSILRFGKNIDDQSLITLSFN